MAVVITISVDDAVPFSVGLTDTVTTALAQVVADSAGAYVSIADLLAKNYQETLLPAAIRRFPPPSIAALSFQAATLQQQVLSAQNTPAIAAMQAELASVRTQIEQAFEQLQLVETV